MKKSFLQLTKKAILPLLLLVGMNGWGQIIISQYYEGASNDKWIEITNIGGSSVDLTSPQLYLCLFANAGADDPSNASPNNNYALTGSISSGGVLIFKNSSAVAPSYALGTSSSICNFNGDDLVVISTSNGASAWTDRVDVIGNGTSWGGNTSFYRNANIAAANRTYTPSEWTQIAYANVNTATSGNSEYIGTHVVSGTTPTITLSQSSLTNLNYTVLYGPSNEQTFTAEGSNLTDDITLTAPTNYEISTSSGTGFAPSLTLTESSGSVATTTIYVRLESGLSTGDYNNQVITASSTGATSQTVTCSGTVHKPVEPDPFIATASSTSAIGLTWVQNGKSDDVLVVYDTDNTFSDPVDGVSYSGSALGGTVIFNGSGTSYSHSGLSSGTTYYYRAYSVDASNNYSDMLDANATTFTPTITLSTSSLSGFSYVSGNGPSAEQTFTVEGSNLSADITLTAPTNFEISNKSGSGFTSTFSLSQSGGTVNQTTIYVRLKSALSAGAYSAEDIQLTSDALVETVTCSGDVIAPISSFPWNETFENGGSMPTGWNTEYANGTVDWAFSNGADGGNVSSAHGGSFNAKFYSSSRGSKTLLISPSLDISGLTNPVLSFWHAQEVWGGDQDELRIYYKTSSAGSWTLISGQEYTSSIASWTQETDIALPNPSSNYYIAFEGTADYGYGVVIDDIEVKGTTINPEPTNHASSFAADAGSTTYEAITLTWTDATGAQVPDGYLIKGSATSYAAISAPADATEESDNMGSLVLNVAQGSGSVTFTGLSASTDYYFKIWPYTNSGSDIDYKTNGTVPTATETTDAAPTIVPPSSGVVFITEVSDASDTDNEFIELYNSSNDIIDLSDCRFVMLTDNLNFYIANYTGDDQIQPKGFFIMVRGGTQSGFEAEFGALPSNTNFNQGSGNMYFGTGTARRWQLVYDDGSKGDVIIDDTQSAVGGTGVSSIQETAGNWTSNSSSNATPGALESGDQQNLPINLLSFSAQQQNSGVELQWVTNAEINNDYFTVERAQDGVNFSEVGRVAGAGNSNVELHYSLMDMEGFQNTIYYRLRQTDYDGTSTLSKVIELNAQSQHQELTNLYVNNKTLHMQVQSNQAIASSIEVYAVDGRLVHSEALTLSKGVGTYQIDLPKSLSGVYLVNLRNSQGLITKRVLVK